MRTHNANATTATLSQIVALLLVVQCESITVLQPTNLTKTSFDCPVMSKFFGPQHNYTREGMLVAFHGDYCNQIPHNFSGMVVLTKAKYHGACSFTDRYLNLHNSGAIAALELSIFPDPGQLYYIHEGDYGKRTKHKSMVWLDASESDWSDLWDQVTAGAHLTMLVSVDRNRWKELYNSWYFIFVLRVFLPILLFSSSAYGWQVARRVARNENSKMRRTKLLVVCIESSTLFLHALFMAMMALTGDDTLPYQAIWFFGTAFIGWSMFATVVVGLLYRALNTSTSKLTRVESVLTTYKMPLVGVFVVCVGIELCVGIMFALYQDATLVLVGGSVAFSLANFGCAMFFVHEKHKFHRMLVKDNRTWGNRSQQMISMSQHIGRWLVLSAVFLVMLCLGSPLIAFPFAWSLIGMPTLTSLLYFARWGVSLTQIVAIGFTPKSNANNTRSAQSLSIQQAQPPKPRKQWRIFPFRRIQRTNTAQSVESGNSKARFVFGADQNIELHRHTKSSEMPSTPQEPSTSNSNNNPHTTWET